MDLDSSGGLVAELLRRLAQPLVGLLLRVGFKNLIKKLVHPISVIPRSLIEDVAPEVCLTALPNVPWKRFPQSRLQGLMRVARCQLDARKASVLELLKQLSSSLQFLEGRASSRGSPDSPPH